jgi:hypothetical protein
MCFNENPRKFIDIIEHSLELVEEVMELIWEAKDQPWMTENEYLDRCNNIKPVHQFFTMSKKLYDTDRPLYEYAMKGDAEKWTIELYETLKEKKYELNKFLYEGHIVTKIEIGDGNFMMATELKEGYKEFNT